jgi:hypothetical protein
LISHAEFLKSKKDLEVDAILTDNNLLPPHAIAEPERVSKVIRALHVKNSIRGIGCCIPLIDLSWAVQCIIQRRRVLFEDEPRFIIKTDSARTTGMEWDLHTVKVKSGDMDVRYEVGDAIEFSRPERSFGRIVAIQSTQQRGKRIQLRIQLLVSTFLIHSNCTLSNLCPLHLTSYFYNNRTSMRSECSSMETRRIR